MRVFLGIDLSKDLKEKIFTYSRGLCDGLNAKRVEKENLHLTLLFLGKMTQPEVEKAKRVSEEVSKNWKEGGINLQIKQAEVFPSPRLWRGIWLSLDNQISKLFSLYKKIIDGLLRAGFVLEERKIRFSPHITVCRLRKASKTVKLFPKIKGEFEVGKFALFESQLSSKGPAYIKIAEFKLK